MWTLSAHGHVYVVLDPEHAGHSKVTLFLDDLDAFVSAAAGRGIDPETVETYGNGVRKTTFRDPDGNEVGLGGAPLRGRLTTTGWLQEPAQGVQDRLGEAPVETSRRPVARR